jgi:hypothetical protein
MKINSVLIFLFFCSNIVSFIDNVAVLDMSNNNNYNYVNIIDYYKKISKLSDEKILLVFNQLQHTGILEADKPLIEYTHFVIFFLEYSVLYAHTMMYEDIIEIVTNEIKLESRKNLNKKLIHLEDKSDIFFEAIFINKIKMYLDYKKNNKDYMGIVHSSYLFIFSFLRAHYFASV